MRVRTLIAAAVALTFLTACGGADEPAAEESTTAPAPSETTPAEPTTYALGDQVDLSADDNTTFSVAVLDYNADHPDQDSVEAGERLDVLQIKACNVDFNDDPNNSDLGTILGFENFKLLDGDSGSYTELDLTPSPAPKPQIETFAILGAGQCAKGWIAYAVPEDVDLKQVSYSIDNKVLATWDL